MFPDYRTLYKTINPFSPVLCLCAIFLISSCASLTGGREKAKATRNIPHLERIAVLPMDRASVRPGQERARCALSDSVFDVSEIPPEASDELTRILYRELEGKTGFFTVPEGKCVGFLNTLLAEDVKASQIRLIQRFGGDLDAEAVLYGRLYRYIDRIGGHYSVRQPASVAFALHLIRVSDGAILWHYNFDESQKPLSENLFKARLFKEAGMKWVTASQLASIGIKRALTDLMNHLQ